MEKAERQFHIIAKELDNLRYIEFPSELTLNWAKVEKWKKELIECALEIKLSKEKQITEEKN